MFTLAQKTIKTPILGTDLQFNRSYTFNRSFIQESFMIIELALNKSFDCGQVLTLTGKTFLRKNEDLLIRLRNWAIYYLQDSNDLNEFNNALNIVMYEMLIGIQ